MTALISVGVIVALSALSALQAAPNWGKLGAMRSLPNPTPFAEGGELRRVEGSFETGEFVWEAGGKSVPLHYGVLKFGNKEIAVRRFGNKMEGRDHGFKVNIDGRRHLSISFAPAWNIDSAACDVSLNKNEDTLDIRIPYLDKDTGRNEQLVCRLWKAGIKQTDEGNAGLVPRVGGGFRELREVNALQLLFSGTHGIAGQLFTIQIR